jgi:hypothetical protein
MCEGRGLFCTQLSEFGVTDREGMMMMMLTISLWPEFGPLHLVHLQILFVDREGLMSSVDDDHGTFFILPPSLGNAAASGSFVSRSVSSSFFFCWLPSNNPGPSRIAEECQRLHQKESLEMRGKKNLQLFA